MAEDQGKVDKVIMCTFSSCSWGRGNARNKQFLSGSFILCKIGIIVHIKWAVVMVNLMRCDT